jgi:hypothetical protein
MNILDCIPIGHKNAIDRDTLNRLMRMGDRQVRRLIKDINDSGDDTILIINLQDGRGYFRPAPDENNLVKLWRAQERSRGSGVFGNVNAADRYLSGGAKKQKKVNLLEKNQISLADWEAELSNK